MRDALAAVADGGDSVRVVVAGDVMSGASRVDASAATWLRLVASGWLVALGHDRLQLTDAGRRMAARCRELRAHALAQGRLDG